MILALSKRSPRLVREKRRIFSLVFRALMRRSLLPAGLPARTYSPLPVVMRLDTRFDDEEDDDRDRPRRAHYVYFIR